jgi:hypothetical protein
MKTRFVLVFLAFVVAAVPVVGQGRGPGPGFGVDGLNNALAAAGATALTSAQQTAIATLITNFRDSQAPPAQSTTASAARTAYETAILAGDSQTAVSQIPTIANEMAANNKARMTATAGFCIEVIKLLDSGQLSLLVKQDGISGVVRLVESLAGGPGMGGGRGPGMMGMRPPRM